MLNNPFGEEIFLKIQSKPPLVQLQAISSCPIAFYLVVRQPLESRTGMNLKCAVTVGANTLINADCISDGMHPR